MSRCRSEPTEAIPELSKNGYRNLLQKSQLTMVLDAELKLPVFAFSVPPKPYLNRIGINTRDALCSKLHRELDQT